MAGHSVMETTDIARERISKLWIGATGLIEQASIVNLILRFHKHK